MKVVPTVEAVSDQGEQVGLAQSEEGLLCEFDRDNGTGSGCDSDAEGLKHREDDKVLVGLGHEERRERREARPKVSGGAGAAGERVALRGAAGSQ